MEVSGFDMIPMIASLQTLRESLFLRYIVKNKNLTGNGRRGGGGVSDLQYRLELKF